MRILFETDSMSQVTPATISRLGIIYVGENLLHWKDMFDAHFNSLSKTSSMG